MIFGAAPVGRSVGNNSNRSDKYNSPPLMAGFFFGRQSIFSCKKHRALDIYQIMLKCHFMETKNASKIFEALSSDVRLDLFRLLVKNAPDGLVQGDIAKHLDIPPTNLSFHLKAITQSGLVDVEREGRFMRYKANIPLMLETIAYLTSECCANHPEECQKFRNTSTVLPVFLPK